MPETLARKRSQSIGKKNMTKAVKKGGSCERREMKTTMVLVTTKVPFIRPAPSSHFHKNQHSSLFDLN
jgi:hypothetical protein